ncbi:hypothetical protein LTR75_018130, partial [Friedmanniomyces endolithicus]
MSQMTPAVREYALALQASDTDRAASSMAILTGLNEKIADINKGLGFKVTDHVIDLGMLPSILAFSADMQTQQTRLLEFAYLMYQTGRKPVAFGIENQRALESMQPSSEMRLSVHATKAQYRAPIDQEWDNAFNMLAQQAPTQQLPTQQLPTQQLPTERSLLLPPSDGPTAIGTDIKPASAQGGLRVSGVRAPVFRDRVTPLGIIDNVQKLSFGYRAIVNICTEDNPVYQSVSGAEFGRGSAEDLSGSFPLRAVDLLQERRKRHVSELKAIIEVPQRASVTRAPITKFLVVWRNEEPSFTSSPMQEWISRSDLMSIYGKTDTERARQSLLTDLRHNLRFLSLMKEQSKHPETGLMLTPSDWTNTPWLCPPTNEGIGSTSNRSVEQRINPDQEVSTATVRSVRLGNEQAGTV